MADPAATAKQSKPEGPDPLIGQTINNRFKILAMVAKGGMGKVYKAEQSPLGRICAVKVLNPAYPGEQDPEFQRRFFLEASIASKLKHPNTVTIYDYGKAENDILYMAMEFLEGKTLHRLIRELGRLDGSRAIRILKQACRSLREAHGHGVIHRDLKPANIYLVTNDDDADFVKILDFGLVKNFDDTAENLTQTGLFMGSPKYMSPEQIRAEKVSPATDVYALGVVLFEMLTGKVPFDKGNSVNTLMAHCTDPVPNLSSFAPDARIPPALEELVQKCMQKQPADRYASMDELLAAIKRAEFIAYGNASPSTESSLLVDVMRPTGEFSTALTQQNLQAAVHPAGKDSIGSTSGVMSRADISEGSPAKLPRQGISVPPGAISTSGPVATKVVSQSEIPPESSIATQTPEPRSKTGIFVAVGLLAFVGAGLVWMKKQSNNQAQPLTHQSSQSTIVPPSNPPVINTPPPERTMTINLESDPPHAEVFEDSTLLGPTPLHLTRTGDLADPNRPHTFVFRMQNYQDFSLTASGTTITERVTLRAQTRPDASTATTPRPIVRPIIRPIIRPNPPEHYRPDPWGNN